MTRGGELRPAGLLVVVAKVWPLWSCHVQTSRKLEGIQAYRDNRTGCRLVGYSQRTIGRDTEQV